MQSIAREGKSAVDAIVIGVGSGGTVTGVGETIKAWTNDVRIAAVEPYESQALGGGLTGPTASAIWATALCRKTSTPMWWTTWWR